MWVRVWTDNCNPVRIACWYFDYLSTSKTIPARIRIDKGSETGDMGAMHALLRESHGDTDNLSECVIFGKSMANQIERWWKELHERFEKFFKEMLLYLLDQGHYDPSSKEHRDILAYVFIPVLEKEIECFIHNWNTHRIRFQKDTVLSDEIPEHIYSFPEKYGLERCGLPVTNEQLEEVLELSGVLDMPDDYLEPKFMARCEEIIDKPEDLEPKECINAFLLIKRELGNRL